MCYVRLKNNETRGVYSDIHQEKARGRAPWTEKDGRGGGVKYEAKGGPDIIYAEKKYIIGIFLKKTYWRKYKKR